jgi:hypothetical protein
MRRVIVLENANGNYAAYLPDLSGCVATAAAQLEVKASSGLLASLDVFSKAGSD